ncbi:late expression factor 4 [Ectropis obliqua nucleopolyhedrovirus]|uniref:Late expression factor 4 n=1 Tax=Ectropis obliqua nucleopolyhedrovirus TaxID=59376 RepID=A0EYX2_9ABAC|nr:late expression factor 4 [Ectropis obliqua nucleopolyhedrovirus]ABI35752.1 late expression factor 4 [Ectropis obliqua nucleopolyhedrovirus]AGS47924.1 late expression factor 4 [Ectropis obliqua nucleopolyhedrovirus]QWV59662.1 late expression factor 4 [Ectropis obliqua nucleopolyhedrovirus]UYO72867.1 late expression factor 4 [Ectropis obliqua nucleopolyhedrovirus]
MMSSYIEKEISYSVNVSQDLLYKILTTYISKKFTLTQEYIDCVDENNVRTRIVADQIKSVFKIPQSLQKFVHVDKTIVVPLVKRVSIEQDVHYSKVSSNLKRIATCQVYGTEHVPSIEIKFEKVYFEKNLSDSLDASMASKAITLLNLLQNKNEHVSVDSHLGSDEILMYMRLEYEYEDNEPDPRILDYMVDIVCNIDKICESQNISPMLPYSTLQNNIIYRKFENEFMVTTANDGSAETATIVNNNLDVSIFKWAIKLDGVRGKGFITRNLMFIFMDDMRMFSGQIPKLFDINNVVAFQCELIGDKFIYITDLLHIFKYTYNNKIQYECSLDGYNIGALQAIQCLNHLADLSFDLHDNLTNHVINVKIQKFFDPPLKLHGYNTVPSDGFIVLDANLKYVKYKYKKTIELEYDKKNNKFCSLEKMLCDYTINKRDNNIQLMDKRIYECHIDNNVITVIQLRQDRFVAQLCV